MQKTYPVIQIVNLEGKSPYSLTDCEQWLSSSSTPPLPSYKIKQCLLVDYLPWRNTLIGIQAESDFNLQGVFETDFQMA